MRLALIVASLMLSTVAFAEPPGMTMSGPAADPEEPGPIVQRQQPESLDESTATLAAVATTVGSIGLTIAGAKYGSSGLGLLGVGGMMIGPSIGHFYAGEWGHALGMSALRSAGTVVFLIGFVEAITVAESDGGSSRHSNASSLMALGGLTYVVTTVYDIYDAGHAARRANAQRLTLVPTVGAHDAMGVALAGRF